MSVPNDLTDSTDWLNTPLSALAPLDAALRCQVCKDFFTTPMITSCSHTFCSLCIRRYLSQEGRCPACRESDQEMKLRRNWSIEEAVAQFKAGRDGLLKAAESLEEGQRQAARPKKRRKMEHDISLPERRSTRSQSRKNAPQDLPNGYAILSSQEEIQDSDEGSVYEDESRQRPETVADSHDGLVACPCCGRRMKETLINSHLDKCIAGQATPSPRRSNTPKGLVPSASLVYPQTKATPPVERLPTLNYSLLTETQLRRKLKDLGIPSQGSKELMRKRHIEWMNLWNANCDSLRPVPKSLLLRDLSQWERTSGRTTDKGPSGVMIKDFDRGGWQRENKGDFEELIRKAREKRIAAKAHGEDVDGAGGNTEKEDGQDPHTANCDDQNKPMSLDQIFGHPPQTNGHEIALEDSGQLDHPMQPPGDVVKEAGYTDTMSGVLSDQGS